MRSAGKYILLTIIPLGVLISLALYYFVDVFYWDEWAIAPLVEKYYTGTLSFSDLFAQHNEHRILTGKALMLLNAVLTNWNMYTELALNIILAVMK